MPPSYQGLTLSPISGSLDLRSSAGEVAPGNYRVLLNVEMNERRRRKRRGGWTKLFSDSEHGFNNQDLHDQLLYQSTYTEEFSRIISGAGGIVGYSYQFQVPGFTTVSSERRTIGWACGRADEVYYDPYPPYPIEGYFIQSSFYGYPWTPCVPILASSLGETIPSTVSVTPILVDDELHFDLAEMFPKIVSPGSFQFYYPSAVEVGPFGTDVEFYAVTQIQVDDDLYVNNTVVMSLVNTNSQPSFRPAGYSFGILPAGQTLKLNIFDAPGVERGAYTGNIIGIRPIGLTTFLPCSTGEPEYCLNSYYEVGFLDYTEAVTPPYGYGDLIPITEPPYQFEEIYCGDYTYTWRTCRENITGLHSFGTSSGSRTLIASTRSRIYSLNERRGNWQIVADNLAGGYDNDECDSCLAPRFQFASLGDYLIASNNYDPVLFWRAGEQPSGCNQWAAKEVEQLVALNITRAMVVKEWKGFIFLGNVLADSLPQPNRLFWSDYNNPESFIPDPDSAAGDHEFPIGETILAMDALGEYLYIHTDRAIWRVVFIGREDEIFRFNEIYRGPNTARYRNSLVNTGSEHLWVSHDSIYVMTQYSGGPQRIQWIHEAAGAIFNGIDADTLKEYDELSAFGPINPEACDAVVGGFNETLKEVWFSWPTDDNSCPNMSLVLNLYYGTADVVDHGFDAFQSHQPDDSPTLGDWLVEIGACTDCDAFTMTKKFGCKAGVECPCPDLTVNYHRGDEISITIGQFPGLVDLEWSADGNTWQTISGQTGIMAGETVVFCTDVFGASVMSAIFIRSSCSDAGTKGTAVNTTATIVDIEVTIEPSPTCEAGWRVSWDAIPCADSYAMFYSTEVDGAYVDSGLTPTCSGGTCYIDWRQADLYNAINYIKVRAYINSVVIGETQTPGEQQTINIESVMRAVQERRYKATKPNSYTLAGAGYTLDGSNEYVNWPDRTLPSSGDPGNYPVANFYEQDLLADEANTAQVLVQYIADVMKHNGWLAFYFNADELADLDNVSSHTMLSTAQLPALTVTTSNYMESLETIAGYLCSLRVVKVPTERIGISGDAERKIRYGDSFEYNSENTSPDCATSVSDSLAHWNASSWNEIPDGYLHVIDAPSAQYDEDSNITGHMRLWRAVRGRSQADLSIFTSGAAAVFYKMAIVGTNEPDSAFGLSSTAPPSALGSLQSYCELRRWMQSSSLAVNAVSIAGPFGNVTAPSYVAECWPDVDDGLSRDIGWEANDELCAVQLEPGDWTHTP